ncbi:MAG: SDR family oxidoreductase [Rhizobiales bacterium]|nr:SDR family oxidoreductase [Hyphomicrobiales bacterium]
MQDSHKVALVTGAAQGIGRAIAIGLAERGFDVAICDIDGKRSALEEVEATIAGRGGKAHLVTADVTNEARVTDMVRELIRTTGRVDAVINNAGILSWGLTEDLSPKQWDDVLSVNAKGTFLVTRALLPHMKERRYGRIVNNASMAAKRGAPEAAHYCASKAAVMGFTRAVAAEAGPYGITANCICPGIIATEMGKQNLQDDKSVNFWLERTCLQRLGDPEDVVGPACFLASDDARFVTGQSINVCGGIIYD